MSSPPQYSIIERLDVGGMAEVFKAKVRTVEGIERVVAVKRVLPHLTDNEKFIGMFLDEARVAMQLNHKNIVHVYDVGVADGVHFLVMEFVEGTHLKAVFEEVVADARRLPLALALHIMAQVCQALAYAHARQDLDGNDLGIVHRDISPPNVLLSNAGEVKLADFGLAKARGQVESTDPGIVKGKFSYLSPEAARGEVVDHRADIFSVGIILWELLAGRRLFLGENDFQTLQLIQTCEVPPLVGAAPLIDDELAEIVARALASDPAQRWPTASALATRLVDYLFSHALVVSEDHLAAFVRAGARGPGQPDPMVAEAVSAGVRPLEKAPGMTAPLGTEEPERWVFPVVWVVAWVGISMVASSLVIYLMVAGRGFP